MGNVQKSSMLANVFVAGLAGALSSVLILAGLHNFSTWGHVRDPIAQESDPAASVSGLTTNGVVSKGQQLLTPANREGDSALDDSIVNSIASLEAALEQARQERNQLAATLVNQSRVLSELESQWVNLTAQRENAEAAQHDEWLLNDESARVDRAGEISDTSVDRKRREFDDLVAAGLDEQSARQILSKEDQYQLARLELLDQAGREGWDNSSELYDRLKKLDAERVNLRTELGDEAYGRYLYQLGAPNSVTIDSIITGSAADQAGLQAGDRIVNYAGERIFTVQELQKATRDGLRGEFVQIILERNGQSQVFDVQRGPLGITLRAARVQP